MKLEADEKELLGWWSSQVLTTSSSSIPPMSSGTIRDGRDGEQNVSSCSPVDAGRQLDRHNGLFARGASVRTSRTDWAQSAVSS
jgi:hypothetical protein